MRGDRVLHAQEGLDDPDDRVIPESGWGALLCWLAGPNRVIRVPATGVRHELVRIERVSAGGATTVEYVVRTAADQESIDDSVDEYLVDAGLPPRPRGYDWILAAPVGAPWRDVGELSRALQRAVDDAGSPADPAEVLAAGRSFLIA